MRATENNDFIAKCGHPRECCGKGRPAAARRPFGHGVDVRVGSSQRLGRGSAAALPCFPELHSGFQRERQLPGAERQCKLSAGKCGAADHFQPLGGQTGSAWYSHSAGCSKWIHHDFPIPVHKRDDSSGRRNRLRDSELRAPQRSGATGGNGGALAYGDADSQLQSEPGKLGFPHSLAIEFDTFQNGWDPSAVNPSVSHVAIQSCGTGPNTSHHFQLCAGESQVRTRLWVPRVIVANMADGAVHNVTITYVPACSTCSPATVANIQVVLDGVSLYPNGVTVDLSSIGLGEGGTALVGFTGATGGYLRESEHPELDLYADSAGCADRSRQLRVASPRLSWPATRRGSIDIFGFDYSVSNSSDSLTIQPRHDALREHGRSHSVRLGQHCQRHFDGRRSLPDSRRSRCVCRQHTDVHDQQPIRLLPDRTARNPLPETCYLPRKWI